MSTTRADKATKRENVKGKLAKRRAPKTTPTYEDNRNQTPPRTNPGG